MKKQEQAAVVRLVRHMKQLQAQIKTPYIGDASEEEVRRIIYLLFEFTRTPSYSLPSKHAIEQLVGLFRGCEARDYCYISRGELAAIIRKIAGEIGSDHRLLVILNKGYEEMTDNQLYDDGRWNYKPTPLYELLTDLHANPQMYGKDGERI